MDKINKTINALPSIDWQEVQTRYVQNPSLGRQIISMFIASIDEELASIRALLDKKEYSTMTRAVHKLYGASSYACTPRIKYLLQTLENHLKEDKHGYLDPLMCRLEEQAQAVQEKFIENKEKN